MKAVSLPSKQRGLSLVEVMISMVIGLVIVGAVLVSILGSGKAGRYQAAYAQMNEDAQVGLSMLSRDLQLAGYSQPTGLVNSQPQANTPVYVLSFSNLGSSTFVVGCDTGFSNPTAATVACGTATTPAFEVVYEADISNTVPTAGGIPSNCLGNAIAGPPFVARNRYFISATNSGRPELYCAGVGGSSQPLIENIEDMRVWYGVQVAANPRQVVSYVSAAEIAAVGPAEWDNVMSVRICFLVRSAEPVLNVGDDTLSYRNCSSATATSNDRYLRRAYFTTATLRSKMPL